MLWLKGGFDNQKIYFNKYGLDGGVLQCFGLKNSVAF